MVQYGTNEGSSQRGKMSEDRIKFFLPHNHFAPCARRDGSNKFSRDTMKHVVWEAFSITLEEFGAMTTANRNGFYIICRPSQFGRFIVARHKTGEGINGIRNLNPIVGHFEDKTDGVPVPEVTQGARCELGMKISHVLNLPEQKSMKIASMLAEIVAPNCPPKPSDTIYVARRKNSYAVT